MDLKVIASGKWNCIAIVSDSVLIVDLGLPKTKAENDLINHGIAFKDVCAVLVTHAHADHCRGLPLADKYKTPVYASEGTFKSINPDIQNFVYPGNKYQIECFTVEPFEAHHDDFQALGFAITDSKGKKASVLFDTGIVTDEMIKAMSESDIYAIESNHDPILVEQSDYPDGTKARILSDLGHLSNAQTAEALAKLVRGTGERIILTHLSKSNNTPELAEQAVEDALEAKGLERILDYQLEVIR